MRMKMEIENVGSRNKWELPVGESEVVSVDGLFLGYVSSQSPSHNPAVHPHGVNHEVRIWRTDSGSKLRCNGCRWTEFRLFREEKENRRPIDFRPYFLHFTGRSNVPGEKTRYRFEEMLPASEVIELLTVRRGGSAYLSSPAARLLAQASAVDDGDLKTAYEQRLVV
jgi:hypothetical protein